VTVKHLGDRLHDLLDNRLSRADACAAMEHLGECEPCSVRWRELRAAREALHSSEAGIDMRFTQQLLDRDRMAEIAKGESRHRARAASGRARRPITLAVTAASLVAVAVAAAYSAGAPTEIDYEFAAASSSGGAQSVAFHGPDSMRAGDQLRAWVQPDWQASGLVPVEAKVIRGQNGDTILVAAILAHMQAVIITEQHGRLNDSLVADLPRADVDGLDVYVVSEDPAHVVWQTGEVVVSALCECEMTTLESVAAAFPDDEQPGFVDRVATGVGEFADALTGH
jgi:anti-sigma factor RsiW